MLMRVMSRCVVGLLVMCFLRLSLPVSAAVPVDVRGAFPVEVERRDRSAQAATGPIIIDHTCTDLSAIPDYWIVQAKTLVFHIARTSHGSQILSGIRKLEEVDTDYDVAIRVSDVVILPTAPGALLIYDGNNLGSGDTYVSPAEYWDSAYGISRTQSVADTGWFDVSTWSWCGEQSANAEATVQRYLNTLTALELQYPEMRFVLMTGHTDGGSATLERNNNMVRQYARDHAMVLFDFADIETYDPLGGGPYVNNSDGACLWCEAFCAVNPEFCTDLPSICAHTDAVPYGELFCKLKGNAFWWMMARLAGWEGPATGVDSDFSASEQTVAPSYVTSGERVTYTIVIRDANPGMVEHVSLHDELPSGMSYASGTLTATVGKVDDTGAPLLSWQQDPMATSVTTVTYAATIDEVSDEPQVFTNTVVIDAVPGQSISRSAVVRVNWRRLFLPVLLR